MSITEIIVREQDGYWQVWIGTRLVSGHPTQLGALHIAEALTHAAAARGERSRLLIGQLDEHPIECRAINPQPRAAPEQGIEKTLPEPGSSRRRSSAN